MHTGNANASLGRITFARLGILVACVLAISCDRGNRPPQVRPTDGAAAQLTADQIQKLNALGIKILIPTYIPPGFRLNTVNTGSTYNHYLLSYEHGKKIPNMPSQVFFWVFAEKTRDRPTIGNCTLPVESPVFGKTVVTVDWGEQAIPSVIPVGELLKRKEKCPDVAINKMAEVVGSDLSGTSGTGPYYHFTGKFITPEDAAKVVESLRWLKQ